MSREDQLDALDRLLAAFPTHRELIRGAIDVRRDGALIVYDTDPATDVDYVLAHWRGLVVCGALAALSRERGWPEIRGREFMQVADDVDTGSALGDLHDVEPASEREVLEVLTESAAKARVKLETVDLPELNGCLAPEVTVVGDQRGARALARPLLSERMVEGIFVLAKSEDGAVVDACGHGVRLRGGVGFDSPRSSVFDAPA